MLTYIRQSRHISPAVEFAVHSIPLKTRYGTHINNLYVMKYPDHEEAFSDLTDGIGDSHHEGRLSRPVGQYSGTRHLG